MSAETDARAGDWTTPGVFAVADGVHRIPLPLPMDGLRAVNVYAIEDGDGLVLVDSGWALDEARDALAKALAALGASFGDVRRFLVTHLHRDHYTQAVALRREFGVPVSLGAGERAGLATLRSGLRHPLEPQLDDLRSSGAAPLLERLQSTGRGQRRSAAGWEAPDEWLADGQELELRARRLRVLPTPGHTQGHVVFADPDAGLLFAGDHVLPHITPSIGFEPVRVANPLGDYMRSLRLVRGLAEMRLLPAHGPVADSVHARVDELLSHHADRLDRCAAAVAGGAATAFDVARRLRWTRHARRLDDLDVFNQMLAVTETRAHLALLAAQGRLTESRDGGLALYAPAVTPG